MYVDGFNLYHRRLQGTPYKWLDLRALAESLAPGTIIGRIRYFTAQALPRAGTGGEDVRQNAYIRALRTLPGVSVHWGLFKEREKERPLRDDPTTKVWVLHMEEKGSDVNLASHLMLDGILHGEVFDQALIISNDSDLQTPIQITRRHLGYRVGVAIPGTNKAIRRSSLKADFYTRITVNKLKQCQLPATLEDEIGTITKPPTW